MRAEYDANEAMAQAARTAEKNARLLRGFGLEPIDRDAIPDHPPLDVKWGLGATVVAAVVLVLSSIWPWGFAA